MAAIQSLGLGSGVFKQSQIDNLKKVDEKAVLDPIKKDITKQKTKSSDLSSLVIAASSAKAAQNPLGEEISYSKNKTSQYGSNSIKATVEDGVSPRVMNFHVIQLAKNDIIESNTFASKDDTISNVSTTLNLFVDGVSYEIPIQGINSDDKTKKPTTYKELVDLIRDKTKGKLQASIVDTGADVPFKIILQSKKNGIKNKVIVAPSIKAIKPVDMREFKKNILSKSDFILNGVNIFDKNTRAKITSKEVPEYKSTDFEQDSVLINKVRIFKNTDKTQYIQKNDVQKNTLIESKDFLLNKIDIFKKSQSPEAQSSIAFSNMKFPIDVSSNGLLINNINVFDNVANTIASSGVLNNNSINDVYQNNDFIINGVDIFNSPNNIGIAIVDVNSFVDKINSFTNLTNVEAKYTSLGKNNFKVSLVSIFPGDNIDIQSANDFKLAKLRFNKGVIKGNNTSSIITKDALIDAINSKAERTGVSASIRNDKLTLSSNSKENIILDSLDIKTLNALGLKPKTYSQSIPISISTNEELVDAINKKTKQTHIVASIKDGKVLLENESLGQDIVIRGNSKVVSQLGLEAKTIKAQLSKTIKTLSEFADMVNLHTDKTNVKASVKNNAIVLEAIKDKVDIDLEGDLTKLDAVGLAPQSKGFAFGQIIQNNSELLDAINEKYSRTNTKAIIKNDKLVLYNPKNTNINIDGKDEILRSLGLDKDMSLSFDNIKANIKLFDILGFTKEENHIQNASNSKFIYNGVELQRESNTVADLVNGVTIELKSKDAEFGKSTIKVELDKDIIKKSLSEFVTSYNSFMRKIEDLTKFQYKKGDKKSLIGSFQGVNDIVSIPFAFKTILNVYSEDLENIKSLRDVGITFLNKTNILDFDESKLDKALKLHYDELKKVFLGHKYKNIVGKEVEFKGIFKRVNDQFNKLTKGDTSVFKILEKGLNTKIERLNESLTKNKKFLDDKYEKMKKDFIANDLAISKANANFKSLKDQIALDQKPSS